MNMKLGDYNMYGEDHDLNELVASCMRTAKGITELKDENYALRMALDEARPLKRGREHPVDRLYYVRQQLKELHSEEEDLKDEIRLHHDFNGIEYRAEILKHSRQTLNKGLLMEKFPVDEINKCYKTGNYTTMSVFKK